MENNIVSTSNAVTNELTNIVLSIRRNPQAVESQDYLLLKYVGDQYGEFEAFNSLSSVRINDENAKYMLQVDGLTLRV